MAYFLECVVCSSTDPRYLHHENIRRILAVTPPFAVEIQLTMSDDACGKVWYADMARMHDLMLKLARSHLDYELGIQEPSEPRLTELVPLALVPNEGREFFECLERRRNGAVARVGVVRVFEDDV